jgi:hypothetical protein
MYSSSLCYCLMVVLLYFTIIFLFKQYKDLTAMKLYLSSYFLLDCSVVVSIFFFDFICLLACLLFQGIIETINLDTIRRMIKLKHFG